MICVLATHTRRECNAIEINNCLAAHSKAIHQTQHQRPIQFYHILATKTASLSHEMGESVQKNHMHRVHIFRLPANTNKHTNRTPFAIRNMQCVRPTRLVDSELTSLYALNFRSNAHKLSVSAWLWYTDISHNFQARVYVANACATQCVSSEFKCHASGTTVGKRTHSHTMFMSVGRMPFRIFISLWNCPVFSVPVSTATRTLPNMINF